jgi:outer membrane protein OmpA-like peptidoglycan-associated protein
LANAEQEKDRSLSITSFQTGSLSVWKDVYPFAASFKKYIELKPDSYLILSGHADTRGSAAYNKALSERRDTRT